MSPHASPPPPSPWHTPHCDAGQAGRDRLSIACDQNLFNFVLHDGYIFCVVSDKPTERAVAFACLERIAQDFLGETAVLSPLRTRAAAPGSLRTFAAKLKQHVDYCSSNPGEVDRVAGLQRQVDDVRLVMVENVEAVLRRGEKLEVLVDKAEGLRDQAQTFQRQGQHLRRSLWWQNTKMKVIVVAAVLLLVLTIFLLACFAGGSNCTKPKQH